MRLITQNTDYAIRALTFMAGKKEEIVSAKEISENLQISWSLLRRILQDLKKKGIIRSHRGKEGGFSLEIPPESIYITKIINIFQGFIQMNKCFNKNKICTNYIKCPLRKKVEDIERYAVSVFNSLTIESLVNEQG